MASANAQDVVRPVKITAGGTVEIVNKYGRVAATTLAGIDDKPVDGKLTASSPKGVSNAEIKLTTASGRIVITVEPSDKRKRIDLVLILPERTNIRVETLAGAVDIGGNFAAIGAMTDTGTITTDVPTDDLTYHFLWTESKPRYIADFDIEKVKEKAAGRYEIKGRYAEVKSQK